MGEKLYRPEEMKQRAMTPADEENAGVKDGKSNTERNGNKEKEQYINKLREMVTKLEPEIREVEESFDRGVDKKFEFNLNQLLDIQNVKSFRTSQNDFYHIRGSINRYSEEGKKQLRDEKIEEVFIIPCLCFKKCESDWRGVICSSSDVPLPGYTPKNIFNVYTKSQKDKKGNLFERPRRFSADKGTLAEEHWIDSDIIDLNENTIYLAGKKYGGEKPSTMPLDEYLKKKNTEQAILRLNEIPKKEKSIKD